MNIIFVVQDLHTEQLGIMTLSSILKKADHKVEIVDARHDKIVRRLKNNNFAILAYSAYSFIIPSYLNLNRKIKEEFNVLSIFGGPHPTIFPDLINEPGVDAVCIGEGEYALLDMMNSLRENKPITNIENWWVKQDGQIFRSPRRPLINNLDNLPFADRLLFKNSAYKYIATSRGCPYRCSYCCEKSKFRRRSVDNVIEELKQIKATDGCDFLFFSDPIFDLSLSWIREFSQRYKKEINLPFYCHTRADLVTSQAIKYLKEANCQYMSIGIETANDYLRNEVLKKDLSKEQIASAANIIKKEGIKLRTSVMLGLPLGTLKDDLETLKFNIQCCADYTDAHALFIHRGLELYDFINKDSSFKSLKLPNKDFYFFYELLDPSEALKIKNLRRIFGLVTGMPFLLPLSQVLIRLPLYRLYLYLYYIWEGLCQYFCLLHRYTGWKGFISGFIKYMRILKKV